MKKVFLFMILSAFFLVGCKDKDNKNSSSSSSLKIESSISSSTTKESSNKDLMKTQPYGLKAPNKEYSNLIVTGGLKVIDANKGTDTRGTEYLNENGYVITSNSEESTNDKAYIPETSTLLPNANNAYGRLIYYYFWCDDKMKETLAKVRIDGEVVFYDATEDYLNSINQELTTLQAENQSSEDLNIEEINNGNLASLVGTWKNGNGDVIIINSDGTTNLNSTVSGVEDSDKTSKIPYARLSDGTVGAALGLFKIGFKNPDGDTSDTSRPRIIISQQGGSYSAEAYYYRQ